MMLHSADYLELFSVARRGLAVAAAGGGRARRRCRAGAAPAASTRASSAAAQYWIATELPRVAHLAALCRSGEDIYARMEPEWF